jgi:hypothetical protein
MGLSIIRSREVLLHEWHALTAIGTSIKWGSMGRTNVERAASASRILGLIAACLMLQGCDNNTYTGTDKIDFHNRTIIEPLPTTTAAAAPVVVGNLAEEAGVLVDGRLGPNGPPVNDAGFTIQGDRLAIPNRIWNFFDIFYPDRRQEVIAFTRGRRPEFLYTPWSGGEDIFTVTFRSRREFPVTIWIVTGPAATPPATPFSLQRVHAMEAILRTLSIWYQERMGLGFSDVRFIDATGDPQAATRAVVPMNPTEDDTWRPLREQIGFEAGRLNIYWVNTVEGDTTRGFSNEFPPPDCKSNCPQFVGAQIVMGQSTGDELLSHEIGHALSLTHVQGLPNFDDTNVMHNASNRRQFLTEGQIVRAHMNSTSILWTLFLDVGQYPPGRDCSPSDANGKCPALDRRVWADGMLFPANN